MNKQLTKRCSYLIGRQVGDNNLRKTSRILGLSRKKLKFIETLPIGEFIFYNGERIERIKFPKFEGSRAYEYERQIIMKKRKNLWQKLKEAFSNNHNEEEDNEVYDYELEYQREQEENEADIDFLEEW